MDSIVRGAIMYLFLLILFRLCGKRTLAEVTSFDVVLLLIISEAAQQGLIDDDNSMTNAMLLIATLVGLDILLSLFKQRSKTLTRILDDVPLIIMENGKLLRERMDKVRVDENDILEAARALHGLERLDQIKYAVIERNGGITIVPAA